ncbi:MAG: DUF983 domain-containing protein [Hyphomonadaceae bacterium]
MQHPSVLSAGLRCRCPNCGEGEVFDGFLKMKTKCEVCGEDLPVQDAGDGPAFFVMFIALILIVPAAMIFELAARPPTWVHVILWLPLTIILSVALLRPFKATFLALQWRHKAGEGRVKE